jgi:hypothetical protein
MREERTLGLAPVITAIVGWHLLLLLAFVLGVIVGW